MNLTTLGFGHFTTVSSHCFANYIISFHKIGDLTVIFRCSLYLNLNLIKSYDIKEFLFDSSFFQFCKNFFYNL